MQQSEAETRRRYSVRRVVRDDHPHLAAEIEHQLNAGWLEMVRGVEAAGHELDPATVRFSVDRVPEFSALAFEIRATA